MMGGLGNRIRSHNRVKFHSQNMFSNDSNCAMFETYLRDGSTHRLTTISINMLHQYKDNMLFTCIDVE